MFAAFRATLARAYWLAISRAPGSNILRVRLEILHRTQTRHVKVVVTTAHQRMVDTP